MKIFNAKQRVVEFSYNELFAPMKGEFGLPSYVLNTFFPYKLNTQYFVLKWSLHYMDKKINHLLFVVTVHSEFAFELENEKRDFQDVMKQLNLFYSDVINFVRENTEGNFDRLTPIVFAFDDVIEVMKAHGFYQHLN
ncbi:hypothetical protein ABIE26_005330 [Pedobacter africanus]|uniref:Uncharacterized protein n=1 Tax=Pedobacter africanus TaxID=151894 RepID=A0ACC6L5A4_9SPHI|nr:hypothetical protein [Pedobacter africanus]MDR6786483.1 hypothetical protein [Pedobacter africanus]